MIWLMIALLCFVVSLNCLLLHNVYRSIEGTDAMMNELRKCIADINMQLLKKEDKWYD